MIFLFREERKMFMDILAQAGVLCILMIGLMYFVYLSITPARIQEGYINNTDERVYHEAYETADELQEILIDRGDVAQENYVLIMAWQSLLFWKIIGIMILLVAAVFGVTFVINKRNRTVGVDREIPHRFDYFIKELNKSKDMPSSISSILCAISEIVEDLKQLYSHNGDSGSPSVETYILPEILKWVKEYQTQKSLSDKDSDLIKDIESNLVTAHTALVKERESYMSARKMEIRVDGEVMKKFFHLQ